MPSLAVDLAKQSTVERFLREVAGIVGFIVQLVRHLAIGIGIAQRHSIM
jgi:hypothetical protein